MNNRKNNNAVTIEALEGRTLFAAAPLGIAEVAVDGGTQLQITGTNKADNIAITQTASGLKVAAVGFEQTLTGIYKSIKVNAGAGNDRVTVDNSVVTNVVLYGGAGNDTLTGGAGNDKIYGEAGNDQLFGGEGDDVIVSIGGGKDVLTGNGGRDSFWTDKSESIKDASADEKANTTHRVSSFGSIGVASGKKVKVTKVSMELNGQDLIDPVLAKGTTGVQNFKNNALFSDNGPVADDVEQGYLGDCYYLATLGAVAEVEPSKIRESVVELGDGTYAVQFTKNGKELFVRVDADLAVNGSALAYADLGAGNSLWVAIMEKAFAYVRTGVASYAAIEAGWMSEAASVLGVTSNSIYSTSSATNLMGTLAAELNAGKAVTFATVGTISGSTLVGSHAYQVVSVTATTLTLRNPWAIDGYTCKDGSNDGYITVTATQAYANFCGATFANV